MPYLCDNSITGNSSQLLNSIIQSHQQRLSWLDLSSNPLGDSALVDMQVSLRQCRHLKELHLDDTNLTSVSLSTLADLVPCLESLLCLCLKRNDFNTHHEGAVEFASAVKSRCKSSNEQKRLYLSYPRQSNQTLIDMRSVLETEYPDKLRVVYV